MKQSFAYIHNFSFPSQKAHGTYLAKTGEAVASLGIRTHLIVSNRGIVNEESCWERYNIKPESFEIIRTKTSGIFSPIIRHVLGRYAHPIATMLFAIQSVSLAYKKKIDIVQTCDPEVILVLSLFQIIYKPFIIYDIHLMPPKWIARSLISVNLFVIDAAPFETWLLKQSIHKSKILLLPMGYSPDEYENLPPKEKVKQRIELSPTRKVIGYVGMFETLGIEKGLFQLIKVGNEIRKKAAITILLVGGPDTLAHKYQQYAQELGYEPDEIKIIPQVLPKDVPLYISACDVGWLVYPDNPRFRHLISPMKILEYAAANIPVIASNFPSMISVFPSQLLNLVEPLDTQTQTEVIVDMIKDHNQIDKIKRLNTHIQQYTWVSRQKKIFEAGITDSFSFKQ